MTISPAGSFDHDIALFFEDGRLGLKYILLRLSVAGLTPQDQRNLRDLLATACKDQDVTQSAQRVREAEAVSPLAVAIADIVENARRKKKEAALGAIFGAHGAVGSGRDPIESAVAGAVAASAIAFLDDHALGVNLDEFLVRDI
jgi:hypothetical protein